MLCPIYYLSSATFMSSGNLNATQFLKSCQRYCTVAVNVTIQDVAPERESDQYGVHFRTSDQMQSGRLEYCQIAHIIGISGETHLTAFAKQKKTVSVYHTVAVNSLRWRSKKWTRLYDNNQTLYVITSIQVILM